MPKYREHRVIFTVPAEGLDLPIAGQRLPAGSYDGTIRLSISERTKARRNFAVTVQHVTIELSREMLLAGLPDASSSLTGYSLDITADYASGSIREDRTR